MRREEIKALTRSHLKQLKDKGHDLYKMFKNLVNSPNEDEESSFDDDCVMQTLCLLYGDKCKKWGILVQNEAFLDTLGKTFNIDELSNYLGIGDGKTEAKNQNSDRKPVDHAKP